MTELSSSSSRKRRCFSGLLVVALMLGLIGWAFQSGWLLQWRQGVWTNKQQKAPDTLGGRIAEAAMWQIGQTTSYDPSYVKLEYPMGDCPLETGVCTDVVIRALRMGGAIDLQKLVHEDMKNHFSLYPQIWDSKHPDTNIDHRRVPNLRYYFERVGYSLLITKNVSDYQAGDIVTCKLPHGADHIMIVGYQTNWKGIPLTIHNAGGGTGQNNCLFAYKLTGHYRVREDSAPGRD